MTSLINLDADNPASRKMQTEELQALLEDISRKIDQPDTVLTLLSIIARADLSPDQIQKTQAERYFRKLANQPLKFYSHAGELVKVRARALIKQWGTERNTKQNQLSIDDMLKLSEKKLAAEPKQLKPASVLAKPLTSSTGFEYRDKVRVQLITLFRERVPGKQPWAFECALRLEDELYRLYKAGKTYCDKVRSVIYNLSDTKNTRPLQMLLIDRQVTPEQFLKLETYELASEETKKEREDQALRGMDEKRTDWEAEAVKQQGDKFQGIFECEECGSNKTGFIQVQIDRADEPMHCFIYCYECKARFSKH